MAAYKGNRPYEKTIQKYLTIFLKITAIYCNEQIWPGYIINK